MFLGVGLPILAGKAYGTACFRPLISRMCRRQFFKWKLVKGKQDNQKVTSPKYLFHKPLAVPGLQSVLQAEDSLEKSWPKFAHGAYICFLQPI